MQAAVRGHESVVVEIVIRCIVLVVAASVSRGRPAVLLITDDGLVHEVPDKAALVLWIFADKVHILPEAAHGVAHRVGVLTLDQGL